MFLKLLFMTFLIPGIFMRAMPHEEGSEQDTIYHIPPKSSPHQTVPGKFIHKHLLHPAITTIDDDHEFMGKKLMPYYLLKGKMVRNIFITTIDPFGYSLLDTTLRPLNFTKKAGNTLHRKTREQVIRNLILVRPGQPFDSLLLKESERLIRAQKYIHDVVSFVSVPSLQADSLDIHIRVMDIWSIIPTFRKTGVGYEAGLADNNFLGSGNRLHVNTRFGKGIEGFVTQWGTIVSNIGKSHITGSLQYYFEGVNDLTGNPQIRKPAYSTLSHNLPTLDLSNRYFVRSFEIYRSFFSPLTRWAGGVWVGHLATRQSYLDQDSVQYRSSRTNIQDLWVAISLPLYRINLQDVPTTRLIISARMLRTRYPGAIPLSPSISLFNDEDFYLAGVGITSRRYIQDRYVFNYGKVEDIPIGRAFGITMGIHVRQNKQFYLGLKAAWGNNYPFGYFSTHLEYGTFIGSKGWSQQVISAKANYYTRLFNAGYWRIRQFIQPTIIIGMDRLPTDNLSLGDAIKGFEELKQPATRMMALTLQTQSYSPWEIYGFRFGPYFFSSLGLLSKSSPAGSGSRFYSALGLGVLIKNNYLLINTFQLSFTFYPYLPEKGYAIFSLNAYKTTDYGLNDFEISKPKVVDYR